MPVFQVVSRTMQSPGPPKKRPTRARQWWYTVLRQVVFGLIFAALASLLLRTGLSILFFILLPVAMSIIITPPQLSNLLHGTLLSGVLMICLELIYFGGLTGIQFFIHTPGFGLLFLVHGPPVALIIVVTTTLTWAVILAPLHTSALSLINQRFNLRDREAVKAVAAFTSTLREEINLDKVDKIKGLTVVICTTARSDAEGKSLLRALGMPFRA